MRQRLSELLGGWRGALETAIPTVAFVAGWMLTGQVIPAVVASVVAVLVLVAVRLLQRQTVRYALSSVLATAIAAVFALRTGQAEAAFLPGILWNAAMGVAALVSVALRWPLLGFVVAAADPQVAEDPAAMTRWREHDGMVTVGRRLTLVLAVLFLARVAIMLPLYFAGQVAWLGVAKIVLGWPAYVAAIAVMATLLLRGRTPLDHR